MAIKKEHLKYPIYLFVAILVAKLGYIVIESFYNYHVLLTTTSPDLNKESIEELNRNGHRISAVGITLLLVPIFYIVIKRFSNTIVYTSMLIFTILTYIASYNLLNKTVDYIVEVNKEKRHDAYYINIFKYGILNNIFSYNSFINTEKIQNNKIDVNDRIILTNTFLLLPADETLIEKLKQRGKEKVADIYIQKYKKEDYNTKYKAFEQATKEISTLWKEFNKARNNLDKQIKDIHDTKKIRKAHDKLIQTLKEKYNKYLDAWRGIDYKIEYQTNNTKLKSIQKDLNKYFRYKSNSKAQQKYKQTMQNKFGHYIEPTRWLNYNNDVSYHSITAVIKEEIYIKAMNKSNNIPKGLSPKSFSNHINVKVEVSKRLKKDGILIPYNFDYSYIQFKKYYKIAAIKKANTGPKKFYKKLEKKIGKNDLKLNFTWNNFINSKFIKHKIEISLKTDNKEDFKNIFNAIKSKDLANFKKLVYLPKIISEVDKMMYMHDDFLDGGKATEQGDEAIKLLYIPPFALSVSIIALLLNIVTIFGMLLVFTNKVPRIVINIVKVALITILIYIPIISTYKSLDNTMLEKIKTPELTAYLNFLEWISYYEQVNAKLHTK